MPRLTSLALFLCILVSGPIAQARLPAGAVAAASPEASEAGAEILRLGGNAIDAAVAVSLVLGVTEPAGSGIGGQTSMIMMRPGGHPLVLNGTSFAPAATPRDAARARLLGGHTASTVPSTLRTLEHAWRHHGSGQVSWAQLVEPAIRYAERGYVLGPFRYRSLLRSAQELRANPATRMLYLAGDGDLPQLGDTIRQPALARTLRRIAEFGAEDFYSGQIARQIADDMAAHGGWITLADLRALPPPLEMQPVSTTYRGFAVHSLPPPAGGWVVQRALNILSHVEGQHIASVGTSRSLWLIDALRAAHEARRRSPLNSVAGNEEEFAEATSEHAARSDFERLSRGGETTHFSVVDADGFMVAATQSLNSYFGARAASEELGFLYNDYMRELETGQADHPFALRPGAAPYSSMSATIVARDEVPVMAVGSPGSARIISAVTQVVQFWIDVAPDVGTAVAAFRVHVVPPEQAYVEGPELAPEMLSGLSRRGLTLQRPAFGLADGQLDPYFGGVHAVAIEQGAVRGAADPRRDGAVVLVPAQ